MKTRKFVRTLIHNLAAFPCQQLSRANPINLTREKGANEAPTKKIAVETQLTEKRVKRENR